MWEIKEHTKAKHLILKKYVEAWAPILSMGGYSKRIAYIDGFSGPGVYAGGEDGSPIVVLDALQNHKLRDRFKSEFVNLFIEKDTERSKILKSSIANRCPSLPDWIKYEVRNGEFDKELKQILGELDEKGDSLAPCLCFVDPFGWTGYDYSVLANFMKYEKAELLVTFMAGYLGRFVWDESHMNSIRNLLSDEQIEAVKEADDSEREVMRFFLENIKSELRKKGIDAEIFHLAFAAYNKHNRLEYYLIHLSKNCKGFEAMKAAMFDAASDGSYKFSDFDFNPSQMTLVDYGASQEWVETAAAELYGYLKKMSDNTIAPEFREILKKVINLDSPTRIPVKFAKNFISCRTVWKYQKSIMEFLERSGKIEVHIENRKGMTYPDRGYIIVH